MGLAYINTNKDFSAIRKGIRLAVPGATGLHLFGGTLADSAVNYGLAGNGTWVGTLPTPEATYVPINGGLTGMDTSILDNTEGQTILMVVRSPIISLPTSTIPNLINTNTSISAINGGSINGNSLTINNTSDGRWTMTTARHNGAGVNTNATTNLTGAKIPPQGQWTLVAARVDNTRGYLADLTIGRINEDNTTSILNRNPSTTAFRIGTRKTTFSLIGSIDVHSAIVYPSWLSDVNLALVAAQLRALAAQKSITV